MAVCWAAGEGRKEKMDGNEEISRQMNSRPIPGQLPKSIHPQFEVCILLFFLLWRMRSLCHTHFLSLATLDGA